MQPTRVLLFDMENMLGELAAANLRKLPDVRFLGPIRSRRHLEIGVAFHRPDVGPDHAKVRDAQIISEFVR